MTTTETKRAKRRTFKDVAAAAHAEGYAEGYAEGREQAWRDNREDLEAGARAVREAKAELENVSLRKLAWSRIMRLVGAQT
jgi:flagellar biosynthesis/type III secretory pathway protein FliH